ncbi:Wzz/FepE/Etk N-terminal domain-containing protein [Octadecabacter sp. G9-8]|uniref:non-specific protein-tyrosine kinase n=1 Tax=Octadecabacter dasysiphoniae TaxID=2909341 RepID=A0ABS9CQF3_9RHOB|nr:Wzz/FepE/Etk N-terminal domain-containing protein [Octadecabacter dasysiphoniae]MCF2869455.1 Wzz/FepE/Etk N-terminal domain-containing protein [Octadecabacter dasysiphoniae]
MENSNDEIDLGHLVRTVWRGKWLIALALVLFGVLGFLYATKIAERVYVASATVSIENNPSQATNLEALVGGLSSEQPSLNTEIYLIKSRQLLRRLVVAEDLIGDPEFNPLLAEVSPYSIVGLRNSVLGAPVTEDYTQEDLIRIAVDRLRTRLTVSNPRQSLVFEISVSTGFAEKSTALANALARTYINDQLLYKEEQSDEAIRFLENRTLELQNELNNAELAVKDFAAGIELVSPEALIAKNRQVKELRDRLTALDATIEQRRIRVEMFQNFDLENATAADVAELDSPVLSRTFITLAEDIDDRARFIDLHTLEAGRAQSDLTQSEAQKASLETAIAYLEDEVTNESRDLLTLQQLQRESEATGEIYGYFLTRLKEAEVQQGTQQPDARLLSAAVEPLLPSRPRVMILTFIIGGLGAVLVAGVILLREMNKNGIRTASDLQCLTSQPILGQIPMAPIKKRDKLLSFLKSKSNTPFSEAVRNLRTSLLLANSKVEPCVILMTSSVPSEGKTTTSIALAHSLAGMGKSVLLMEGDIRKNTLGQYFDRLEAKSVEKPEIMTFADNKITVNALGFDVMLGVQTEANAADYLSSQAFKNLIDEARENYDHVIIDAPPVLPVTDARIIGQQADAVLLAVAWDATQSVVVEAGLGEISNSGLNLTGLILTRIDGKKARSYGGPTRYGSYYGEYSKSYN